MSEIAIATREKDRLNNPFQWFTVTDKQVELRKTKNGVHNPKNLITISDRQVKKVGTVIVTVFSKKVEESQLPPGAEIVEKNETEMVFRLTGSVGEGKIGCIKFNGFNIGKQNIVSISDEYGVIIW